MWPPRGRPGRCKKRHSTPMMAERNRKWNIKLLRWLVFLVFFLPSPQISPLLSVLVRETGCILDSSHLFFALFFLPQQVISSEMSSTSMSETAPSSGDTKRWSLPLKILMYLRSSCCYVSDFTPGSGWRVWGDETGEKARERRALRNML